jgi:hypothetical protein
MSKITIKYGEYKNAPIINQEFTLVKGFQKGKNSNFVTVLNEGQSKLGIKTFRVKVDNIKDIEWGSSNPIMGGLEQVTATPEVVESDLEAMDRIKTRFDILDDMSRATIAGFIVRSTV